MYLLGHLGSVLFVNYLVEKKYKIKNSKIFLGIGSMFPDMVDKPIGSLLFNKGRWYGHSLLFLFSVFVLLLLIDKLQKSDINFISVLPNINQKSAVLWFIGSIGHILGDYGIVKEVVFHPLFGPFPPGQKNGFLFGFQDPATITLEFIGFLAIILIGYDEKWDKTQWIRYVILLIIYAVAFLSAYFLFVILSDKYSIF